jgi:hypothetical protein
VTAFLQVRAGVVGHGRAEQFRGHAAENITASDGTKTTIGDSGGTGTNVAEDGGEVS